MAWQIELTEDAERDFELILDHLMEAYESFGESRAGAFEKAVGRLDSLRRAAEGIARAPHRGTRRDHIAPGLRHVTIDRAIFWFDLDEAAKTVRILAVFFGRQDHIKRMLRRLLGG
jgi:plasmid stabilization system protein ParE